LTCIQSLTKTCQSIVVTACTGYGDRQFKCKIAQCEIRNHVYFPLKKPIPCECRACPVIDSSDPLCLRKTDREFRALIICGNQLIENMTKLMMEKTKIITNIMIANHNLERTKKGWRCIRYVTGPTTSRETYVSRRVTYLYLGVPVRLDNYSSWILWSRFFSFQMSRAITTRQTRHHGFTYASGNISATKTTKDLVSCLNTWTCSALSAITEVIPYTLLR
jgi:hypothetical protein